MTYIPARFVLGAFCRHFGYVDAVFFYPTSDSRQFAANIKETLKRLSRQIFLEFSFALADQAKSGQASQHEKLDEDQKIDFFKVSLAPIGN